MEGPLPRSFGSFAFKVFDRKFDVQQFLDEVSTNIRQGNWIDPRSRTISFDDWAMQWWKTTTKLRQTTRRGYWGILSRRVRPYFKRHRLIEITYMDVETFIADLLNNGLSPKYVRECVSVVSHHEARYQRKPAQGQSRSGSSHSDATAQAS